MLVAPGTPSGGCASVWLEVVPRYLSDHWPPRSVSDQSSAADGVVAMPANRPGQCMLVPDSPPGFWIALVAT